MVLSGYNGSTLEKSKFGNSFSITEIGEPVSQGLSAFSEEVSMGVRCSESLKRGDVEIDESRHGKKTRRRKQLW